MQFQDLPENVIKAVKASILDNLACIYAGTAGPDVKEIQAAVKNWGGKPSSTLIGAGGVKVPPVNAVLANGSATHQDIVEALALLNVMERHGLSFEQITKVEMEVGKINLTRCRPVEVGAIPGHRIDMLSNLNFAVAGAIRHRNIPLALFHDAKAADDVIVNALPKVSWRYSERQNTASSFENGRVEISTVSGQTFKGECDTALGHPDNPMTAAQCKAKFLDCSQLPARPLSEARALQIIDMVERLDELQDIAPLMELLA